MYSYDRTAARSFDPSILGFSPSELKSMDDEERHEALLEALNRAGDIAEHLASAFKKDLGSDRGEVMSAAKSLQQLARKLGK